MKNKVIFKFSLSSFLCFIVDYVLYVIFNLLFKNIVISNYLARFISSIVNYNINKNVVFKNKNKNIQYIIEYFCLVLIIISINTFILNVFVSIGFNIFISKICTEILLFLLSYYIQNNVIFNKKIKYDKLYVLLIVLFSIYFLLDTFLITKEITVIENNETSQNVTIKENEVISDENHYKDENIEVKISEYYEYNTRIYVADIYINNPEYLKSAFANDKFGQNITEYTSTIAGNKNAIVAINGDFYGVQKKGYIIRNGVLYRNKSKNNEDLVIYKDGHFEIIREGKVKLTDVYEKGAYNVYTFGPALINNGEIVVTEKSKVQRELRNNSRTAIGYIDNSHYIFVVADGRSEESIGLSLFNFATFMSRFNLNVLYNLDGGGSSTLYFNGRVVNKPTSNGKTIKERKVSDIVYVGYE